MRTGNRAETGTMEFGDDWRGVFIRGKHAGWYALLLEQAIERMDENYVMEKSTLKGLASLLSGSGQHEDDGRVQKMRPFAECVAPDATKEEP